MNTLSQYHFAIDDSLGELVDRLDTQQAAAITHLDLLVDEGERRQAVRMARFRWRQGIILRSMPPALERLTAAVGALGDAAARSAGSIDKFAAIFKERS